MKGNIDCPCGCGMTITEGLRNILESLERHLQESFGTKYHLEITSGARCEKYNEKIGGAKRSAHKNGLAADIKVLTSPEVYLLMKLCFNMGIKRIGNGQHKGFMHIDIDESLPKFVMWRY